MCVYSIRTADFALRRRAAAQRLLHFIASPCRPSRHARPHSQINFSSTLHWMEWDHISVFWLHSLPPRSDYRLVPGNWFFRTFWPPIVRMLFDGDYPLGFMFFRNGHSIIRPFPFGCASRVSFLKCHLFIICVAYGLDQHTQNSSQEAPKSVEKGCFWLAPFKCNLLSSLMSFPCDWLLAPEWQSKGSLNIPISSINYSCFTLGY